MPEENVFGHSKKARLVLSSLARLREQLGRGLEVLDVGCGNGEALTRFLTWPGDRVLGIDRHGPSIEHAARRFAGPGLAFRLQDVEALATEERRFDAVVLADVLEHLPQPAATLRATASLLRPGGRALVSVPNGYGPFEIESWVSRLPGFGRASLWLVDRGVAVLNRFVLPHAWDRVAAPPDLPYNCDSGHVHFFTRGRLLGFAADAGLEPVRWSGLSWLSGPYTNYLFAASRLFCDLNVRLADRLPHWMVSGWFAEFAPRARTLPQR